MSLRRCADALRVSGYTVAALDEFVSVDRSLRAIRLLVNTSRPSAYRGRNAVVTPSSPATICAPRVASRLPSKVR